MVDILQQCVVYQLDNRERRDNWDTVSDEGHSILSEISIPGYKGQKAFELKSIYSIFSPSSGNDSLVN